MSDDMLFRERFCAFFEQGYPSLMRWAEIVCARYPSANSAKDLLHHVFIKAIDKLDPKKGEVAWGPWLFKRIRQRAIDEFRRGKRAPVMLAGDVATAENTDLIANAPSDMPSPAEFDDLASDAQLVRQALARMKKPQEHRVLELRYFSDRDNPPTLKEIAAAMGKSLANAKQLHARALKSFKKLFAQFSKNPNFSPEKPHDEP